MALAPNEIKQLSEFINARWSTKKCSMCGSNNWDITGHITLIVSDVPGLMQVGSPALPCAAAICQFCGNTVIVNLVVAGIVR